MYNSKKISLTIILSLALFLLAPTGKAKADQFGCVTSDAKKICTNYVGIANPPRTAYMDAALDCTGACPTCTTLTTPCPVGCCHNGSSGQDIIVIQSADCAGFQETWTAGACPSASAPASAPAGGSSAPAQTNCKLDSTGREICSLENPIGIGQKGTTEVTAIISLIIKTALGIIGAITLLMLIWGGFQWLTSAGNDEKVHSGTQTMVWAVIGVILVFASYLLLSTFTDYLTGGK